MLAGATFHKGAYTHAIIQRSTASSPGSSSKHFGVTRGTDSHDVVVDDVFVPAERTYSFFDRVQLDRPLYRMPFMATMAAGCASVCLGIAKTTSSALKELAATQKKVDPGPGL